MLQEKIFIFFDFTKIKTNKKINDGYSVNDLFHFCASYGMYFRFYHFYLNEEKTDLNFDVFPKNFITKKGYVEIKDDVFEELKRIIY